MPEKKSFNPTEVSSRAEDWEASPEGILASLPNNKDQDHRSEIGEFETLIGIVPELGRLGPGAVIFEAGLAKMFHHCQTSIKRAVQRGELPPPIRLLGAPCWTAGSIVRHLEERMAQVAKERNRLSRKMQELRP